MPATCSIKGCPRPHKARGLCKYHWQREVRARAAARPPAKVAHLPGPTMDRLVALPRRPTVETPSPGRPGGRVVPLPRPRPRAPGRPKALPRPCSVEGCPRPHKAAGLCKYHWQRQDRGSAVVPPPGMGGNGLVRKPHRLPNVKVSEATLGWLVGLAEGRDVSLYRLVADLLEAAAQSARREP